MRKYFLAALAAIGLLFVGIAPASAAEVPTWTANQESAITSPTTALLKGSNTSIETTDLDRPIQTDQAVTIEFELGETAVCTAGAPRIFIELDGVYVNSWDQGDNACADGVLTVTAPNNGRIGAAGIVYDNGTAGEVHLSNLKVNGELVYFEQPPIKVALVEPSTVDPTCESPALLNLPEAEGLSHYLLVSNDDQVLEPGTQVEIPEGEHDVARVILEAVAAEGYTIGDHEGWRFNIEFPDCSTPDPTPTPTPTEPTPTPTSTPTVAPTATPTSPSAPDDDGEELPDTGPETLWMAIAGLGLLGAGSLVLLRQRTQ